MSRPIVVIVCMTWLLRIVGPYQHPHPWHSRAGGGAVHSIRSGLPRFNKIRDILGVTLHCSATDHTAASQGTFMANKTDDTLTFALIARIPPEGVGAFRAYEDQVLPLMNEHGGQLQRRLRNEAGTVELHIVSFPSDIAHRKYR